MKKLTIFLPCLIVMSAIGLYLSSEMILTKITDKVLDELTTNIKPESFNYSRPVYGSVKLSNLNAVTWTDVSVNGSLTKGNDKTTENIALKIGEVTVSLEDLSNHTLFLNADRVSIVPEGKERSLDMTQTSSRMKDGHLEILLSFGGFSKSDILDQLHVLKEEMTTFSTLGVTKTPIVFSATEQFDIQKQPCEAKFSVIQEDDQYRLVMDKDDLQKIVVLLAKPKPNPAEIDVIARNPLKASVLLKIRDKAATTAKLTAEKNPKVPEDAYRHTLWSYLLTQAYGEKFAKEVTDAHEAYPDEEEKSTPLDFSIASYQDLINNALGRQYAVMKLHESDILEKVLTDPAIIKDNEATSRFEALDYENLKPAIHNPSEKL